jgi:hypothetical protein
VPLPRNGRGPATPPPRLPRARPVAPIDPARGTRGPLSTAVVDPRRVEPSLGRPPQVTGMDRGCRPRRRGCRRRSAAEACACSSSRLAPQPRPAGWCRARRGARPRPGAPPCAVRCGRRDKRARPPWSSRPSPRRGSVPVTPRARPHPRPRPLKPSRKRPSELPRPERPDVPWALVRARGPAGGR